jgi:hypothetical protein
MYGHEVPVDFIQLPPRALPQDWIAVTVADVAEMLRQARVREPWHAPELGCLSLAQCINNPLGYRSVDSPGKAIPKKRRGHDCGVNENRGRRPPALPATSQIRGAGSFRRRGVRCDRCHRPAAARSTSRCADRRTQVISTSEDGLAIAEGPALFGVDESSRAGVTCEAA